MTVAQITAQITAKIDAWKQKAAEVKKAIYAGAGTATGIAAYAIANGNLHGTPLTVCEWVVGIGAALGVGKVVHKAKNADGTPPAS